MAKTNGQKNPPWTREETILALDLLIKAEMTALSDSHPDVLALSSFIRSLPSNFQRARHPSFRNPAGVSFKLSNLLSLASGKGFANGSAKDKLIWAQFENRRKKLREVVQLIRAYGPSTNIPYGDEPEEYEFLEGNSVTRAHRHIERSSGLRKAVLKNRLSSGYLICDVCERSNPTGHSEFESAIFEVHHLKPLSLSGQTVTSARDAALLCANCHRLTHKLISMTGRWVTTEDVRAILASS